LSALQDPLIRDYISPEKFARLCSRHGITPDTLAFSTATREIPKYAETKHAVEDGDKR
jgi:hypothetical protein